MPFLVDLFHSLMCKTLDKTGKLLSNYSNFVNVISSGKSGYCVGVAWVTVVRAVQLCLQHVYCL